ncbi:hypothetical protein GCM10023094_56330 [Rhodococcus olei]|uniref:Aminoglycoside phosphotransferase domain-containing protein n=1 Tax=Rhodococcus olei TaxID=2161675 RepID=A0ABP8PSS9_9NOCA
MTVAGLSATGQGSHADSGAQFSGLAARLIAAVSRELEQIGSAVNDRETAAKLQHARGILDWVGRTARSETGVVADLESQVLVLTGTGSPDSTAPELAATVHRLLVARGQLTADGSHTVTAGDEPAEPPLSPERVTGYLRGRAGGVDDVAHSVRTIHGGFSKRTMVISCTLAGESCEIVIRQVPLGRSGRSLAPEFDVVRAAHASGLPVPEPLWIEPNDNSLGGPFFVTRRSAGENLGDVWGPAGATSEICLEVAKLYARLHAIDVEGLEAPISPRTTRTELEQMLDWQENTLVKRGIMVEPVLAALFAWLRAYLPPAAARRSLIHGDAAFSNLLIEGGHVSAILDWEAAHLGDPAEELAYLRPSIEPVMAWSDFMNAYVSAGGTEPDPSALRFYEVWQHVWRHIGCLWLSQNFDQSGRYASAVAAYVHGPRFLNEAVVAAFGTPAPSGCRGTDRKDTDD